MMALETKPFDAAEYLHDEDDIAGYLEVLLEDEHFPVLFAVSIATAVRARGGLTTVARESGIQEAELDFAIQSQDMRALPTLRKLAQAYRSLAGAQKVA